MYASIENNKAIGEGKNFCSFLEVKVDNGSTIFINSSMANTRERELLLIDFAKCSANNHTHQSNQPNKESQGSFKK